VDGRNYCHSALAVCTDTVAAIHTAAAICGSEKQGKDGPKAVLQTKVVELSIFNRCMGTDHERTKQTRAQVEGMAKRNGREPKFVLNRAATVDGDMSENEASKS
jgi:hypothetical protein